MNIQYVEIIYYILALFTTRTLRIKFKQMVLYIEYIICTSRPKDCGLHNVRYCTDNICNIVIVQAYYFPINTIEVNLHLELLRHNDIK